MPCVRDGTLLLLPMSLATILVYHSFDIYSHKHSQKMNEFWEAMRVCRYLFYGLGLEVIAYIPSKQEPVSTFDLK